MSRYLCPVCRSSTKAAPQTGLNFKSHLQILFITAFLVATTYYLIGPWGAAKATLAYLPIWTLAEWVHWLKVREALRCRVCDFDPMLYQRDWRMARKKIEIRMLKLSEELQERIQQRIVEIQAQRPQKNPEQTAP
jgi:hypothetical protein